MQLANHRAVELLQPSRGLRRNFGGLQECKIVLCPAPKEIVVATASIPWLLIGAPALIRLGLAPFLSRGAFRPFLLTHHALIGFFRRDSAEKRSLLHLEEKHFLDSDLLLQLAAVG